MLLLNIKLLSIFRWHDKCINKCIRKTNDFGKCLLSEKGEFMERKLIPACYAAVTTTANERIVATTTTDGVRPKDGS